MKKTTILLTLLLCISTVFISNPLKAQSCQKYWNKMAGGNDEDFGQALATDASGNLYATGNFYSQSIKFGNITLKSQPYINFNYGSEMFLVKYDSCGTVQWAKAAGGNSGGTSAQAIATDVAGNIYVTGYFQTDTVTFGAIKLISSSNRAAFIVKYDAGGNALWAVQGSGNGDNIAQSIAVDASNNVYVSGEFTSSVLTFGSGSVKNGSGGNANDVFIVKYDNSGNFQWLRSSNDGNSSSGIADAYGYGIGVDAGGNVYVGGTFSADYIRFGADSLAISPNAENDIYVVKYNSNGTEQWLRTAGSGDDDEALSLAADASGNVYITGYIGSATSSVTFGTHTLANTTNGTMAFLAKYDANGTAQWVRGSKGDPNPNAYTINQAYHVTLDANNNPNIIGFYTSDSLKLGAATLYNAYYVTNQGGGADDDALFDVFVACYQASNGNLSWARTAGGDSSDYGYGIAAGKTHGIYVTGEYSSPLFNIADTTLKHATASLAETGDVFISNDISMSSEQAVICQVTADSLSQYNVMIWDKTAFTDVAEFIIYRETTTNMYTKIGSQPFTALSQYIDTARSIGGVNANGNPNTGAYRYKLQTVDTSGNYGQMSLYHNTVHFIQTPNTGSFSWNTYDVENSATPVSTFSLEIDINSTGNWQSVPGSVVTGNQISVTDPNYNITTNANSNYRVAPSGFDCTPAFRLANGNNSTYANKVKAHSNQSNNKVSGINKLTGANYQVSVYPNPNNGNFTIESNSTGKQTLQVFDVNGKLVLSQTFSNKTNVDASILSEGVYNLTIIGNEAVVNKKMVIVR